MSSMLHSERPVVGPSVIKNSRRIAVLLAPRLGDSLLIMTIAHNLQAAGRQVSVFGDYAHDLSDWFPALDIHPSLVENEAAHTLEDFDLALQMHVGWPFDLRLHHPNVVYYDQLVPVTGRGFVKLFQIVDFCRPLFGLTAASIDNGLRSKDVRGWRRYPNRVVIHPTSTGIQRSGSPFHFRELGLRLKENGFQPCYIVSPSERSDWLWVREEGLVLPELPSLSAVARFIHESGWFIGNESGIGHLSSNLGIPTLSLTEWPTRTHCWLPSWSPGRFVYPRVLLGGRMRDRYWRAVLSPRRVLKEFERFRRSTENSLKPPFFITLD